MTARACVPLLAIAVLASCAIVPPPAATPAAPPAQDAATAASTPGPAGAAPYYRCDQDIAFSVQFGDGTAVIDAGPRGKETLLRDAGGTTPQQTVYSSTTLKAEFGLGARGQDARLLFASPPLEARCTRER